MRNKLLWLPFILVFLFLCIFSSGQFNPDEIAERAKWEAYLEAAEIIDSEQPWSRREAVTEPWKLTLEKDGIQRQAIWKDPEGRQRGYVENWRWEIAAYQLDKYLGLNMVPPTIEKRFNGDRGSCQLIVDYEISLKDKYENNIDIPSYRVFHWNRALFLQRAFDNLIANEDRHQNQFLITKDWRILLIDHSRSFRTSKKFTKNLIYDENYHEGPRLMKQLPRTLVEKIKSLNFDVIREVTGEYLKDDEIEAVLMRRDLIIDWINKRIEEMGEEKVLY